MTEAEAGFEPTTYRLITEISLQKLCRTLFRKRDVISKFGDRQSMQFCPKYYRAKLQFDPI